MKLKPRTRMPNGVGLFAKELVAAKQRHLSLEKKFEQVSQKLRVLGFCTLIAVLVTASATFALVYSQFSGENRSNVYEQSDSSDELKELSAAIQRTEDLLQQVVTNQSLIESPSLPSIDPVNLESLEEKLDRLVASMNEPSIAPIIAKAFSGLAWFGVVFLFSSPLVAQSLSGKLWNITRFRTLSTIVLLLGLAGSVSGLGLIFGELGTSFIDQFFLILPPVLAGTSAVTFATVVLRQQGRTLSFRQLVFACVISVLVSLTLFLMLSTTPDSCSNSWELLCKGDALIKEIEFNAYVVSFLALLLALVFYVAASVVAVRLIASRPGNQ